VTDARRAVRLAGLRAAGRVLLGLDSASRIAQQPPLSRVRERRLGGGGRLRLLLIRPDHLGDVLLAAPTGHLLAEALPHAQIDWLVGEWSAEVVRRSGQRGDILTCEFPAFTRRPKRSPIEPYALLWSEARLLRSRHYDAALVLRPDHWWGALLAALARIPRRFGFDIPECRPFLTDTLPIPTGHALTASQDLGLLAARRLGSSTLEDGRRMPAYLDPTFAVTDVERQRAALSRSHADDAPVIAIHPGAGAVLKNWPIARWAAVASALQERTGAHVVLTGGPAERDLATEIAAQLPTPPVMLAGDTSLGELAAVFAGCDLVLGGDSGPLHLAAAVGTPTLRVYGPTSTAIFGPWGPPADHRALVAGLSCQPCAYLTSPPCGATREPACLRAVTVDEVVGTARAMIHSRASSPLSVVRSALTADTQLC
jgi:lipopolysaccharide heptosyltransferase II